MVIHTTLNSTAAVDPGVLEMLRTALQGNPELLALSIDSDRVPLPPVLVQLLRDAVTYLAAGENVRAMPERNDLSVQQAAGVLNIRAVSVNELLDEGEIPFETIAGERRIGIYRLMIYKSKRDARRRHALNELTQLSEEMGLYEFPDEQ